ncbi:MAG: MFS transporter [Burkholderiaceae bacterium]|nr:MFS transporter [Microbacteriaceae bacterium]
MNETSAHLWRGRTLIFVAILLVALNLRTAVAGLSPIIPLIQADFPLDTLQISLLGSLAPLCFAVGALVTAPLSRRFGLERMLLAALVLMVLGHGVRTVATGWVELAVGTLIALFGMGLGNVLMPPIVKRYFPDRLGLMTALYLTFVAFGALVPALIAVPVGEALTWRAALGQWGLLALIAVVPWLMLVMRGRGAAGRPPGADVAPDGPANHRGAARPPIWRSPTALAITTILAVSSVNAYAMFAWLPVILRETAGTSPAAAGALLALFAGMGAPVALLMPLFAARMRNVSPLVHVGVALFVVGYSGLLLAPTSASALWVLMIGAGPLMFPLSFVLINLRSSSPDVSLSLSGFSQSVAYLLALGGPPLLGVLRDGTGGWAVGLVTLAVLSVSASVAGVVIARGHLIEDELARHRRR